MKKIFSFVLTAMCVSASLMAQKSENKEQSPMLLNAVTFLDVPYVANTLETDGEESLIFNCDEVDCTTFVEYVLAMSLCKEQGNEMSETEFANNVQKIRYRDGVIDGYTSRLHYMTDWINNGIRNGFLEDVTGANSQYTTPVKVSYMSTYSGRYKQLANSPENVAKMKTIENSLSGEIVKWIPKDKVKHSGEPYIKNGDIILITSSNPNLDIAHMGIAFYVGNTLTMLHASSDKEVVLAEPLSLRAYLKQNDNFSGIRVVRMVK